MKSKNKKEEGSLRKKDQKTLPCKKLILDQSLNKKDNVKNPSKTEKENSNNSQTPMLDSSKKLEVLKINALQRKWLDIKLEETDKSKKEKDKKQQKRLNKNLSLKAFYSNKWLKKKSVKLKKKLIIMSKLKFGPRKRRNLNNLRKLKMIILITLI